MTPRPAADRSPSFLEPLETRALLASVGGIALHPQPGLTHEFHERQYHTMSFSSDGDTDQSFTRGAFANEPADRSRAAYRQADETRADDGSMRISGVVYRHVEVLILTIGSVSPPTAPDQSIARDHSDHHVVHRAPPPQSDTAVDVPQPAQVQTATDVVRSTAPSDALLVAAPKVTFIPAADARATEFLTNEASYIVRSSAASIAESNLSAAAALFRSTFGGGTTQALSLEAAELPRVAIRAAGQIFSAAKDQLTAEAAQLARGLFSDAGQIEREFHFQRLGNPLLMMGDAIAAFADENAIVGQTARAVGVAATSGHAKAWAVTAAVVCADAAILLHWRRNRKRAAALDHLAA